MAVRPITVMGHKALHSPTKRVREITDEVRTLVADMYDTMDAAEGVGLAANQVASRLRIFVYDCSSQVPGARGVVINPVLEKGPSVLIDDGWEGCLSVPGEGFPTPCAEWAKVTGTDLEGREVVVEGTGLLARCLQHETGHLDGKLYLDRLLPEEKAKAREATKARGWEERRVLKWDPSKVKAEDV